ncbi:MAG: hypothetical protein ACXVB9_15485 [Bdellovibrionota bacterium]
MRFLIPLAYAAFLFATHTIALGDDTDFWQAAQSGDAQRGSYLDPGAAGTRCDELSGVFDPGAFVTSNSSLFKARYIQVKRLHNDENSAKNAKDALTTPNVVFESQCKYWQNHQQDVTAIKKLTAARDAYSNAIEAYKTQLTQTWSDAKTLAPMLENEYKQREQIMLQNDAAAGPMSKGRDAIRLCEKRLANLVSVLKDNGKYALSVADKLKSCAP